MFNEKEYIATCFLDTLVSLNLIRDWEYDKFFNVGPSDFTLIPISKGTRNG